MTTLYSMQSGHEIGEKMGILEVVLLAVGAIIFLVSFCIPVKEEKLKEETRSLAAEEVKSLVAEELEAVRERLTEYSEEEIKEQIDKSERTMERISNEKIMAVNEYSDTVLDEIHKNHEEVVFLYDMLKNKKESLSESYDKADLNLQELLQQVKDSEITVKEKLEEISEKIAEYDAMKEQFLSDMEKERKKAAADMEKEWKKAASDMEREREKAAAAIGNTAVPAGEEPRPEKAAPAAAPEGLTEDGFKVFAPEKVEAVPKKRVPKRPLRKLKPETESPAENRDAMLLLSDMTGNGEAGNNSNIRILKLHEAGKSNMAIARELGLGIGEVQLVIDLYEGFK